MKTVSNDLLSDYASNCNAARKLSRAVSLLCFALRFDPVEDRKSREEKKWDNGVQQWYNPIVTMFDRKCTVTKGTSIGDEISCGCCRVSS